MVLPARPLRIVIGTSVTAAGAGALGIWGHAQRRRAQSEMRSHAARYEERHAAHLVKVDEANAVLKGLGLTQRRAQDEVICRMKDFLERHAKQVRAHEHLILDGVDGSTSPAVGLAKLEPDVAGWVSDVVGSAIAAAATRVTVRTAVSSFATASTGAPISRLRGAAATNATLAWLAGGSQAAGGGGKAMGRIMLNVASAGPALLVGGVAVKNRGARARTEAETLGTVVDIAIGQLDTRDELLRAVQVRANEIDAILARLVAEATDAMDLLESEPFDLERHAERLQKSLILVKSVRDVATAPIADEDGNVNERTDELVLKYRNTGEEAADGR